MGFFYLICQLIPFPTRMADREQFHAVTMVTVTKRGRAWKGRAQSWEMNVERAGEERVRAGVTRTDII